MLADRMYGFAGNTQNGACWQALADGRRAEGGKSSYDRKSRRHGRRFVPKSAPCKIRIRRFFARARRPLAPPLATVTRMEAGHYSIVALVSSDRLRYAIWWRGASGAFGKLAGPPQENSHGKLSHEQQSVIAAANHASHICSNSRRSRPRPVVADARACRRAKRPAARR